MAAPEAVLAYLLAWHHSGLRSMDIQEARRRVAYLVAQDPAVARAALEAFRRSLSARHPSAVPEVEARHPEAADRAVESELLALAKDFTGAAERIEREAAALPRRPGPACRAGQLLALAGKTGEARRRLEEVAAEWPDRPEAYRHLERLARDAGDAAAADGFRARAESAGAYDKKTCFEAAQYFMTIGELEWARDAWRKITAAPGERFYYDTNADEYLGHLAIRAGDGETAAACFRRVLQERELRESSTVEEGGVPYAALVHFGTGRAAEAREDRAAAVGAYAKALRLAPVFPDVREALARLHPDPSERASHREAAIALWRDRIADAPRDPEPRYRLAKLLLEIPPPDGVAEARDEARRLAREARDRFPGEARYEDLVRRMESARSDAGGK